ncbi:hypothetical protein C8J56DRAFT_984937 [Mycena floridula]|nr:hypothetical protein C8J56DRAFT_984937 [Mycena floridula]
MHLSIIGLRGRFIALLAVASWMGRITLVRDATDLSSVRMEPRLNHGEKRLKTVVDTGHLALCQSREWWWIVSRKMEDEAESPLALPIAIWDGFGDIGKVLKNGDPFFLE